MEFLNTSVMSSQKEKFVEGIRSVHKRLRSRYRAEQDFDKIWEEHCKDEERLKEYAKAMLDLATVIWDEDCDGKHRIQWCVDVCQEYFRNGGMQNILDKDSRRKVHFLKNPGDFHCGPNPYAVSCSQFVMDLCQRSESTGRLHLLDVGSCYNPFQEFEEFQVTAIDLKPACKSVYQCDLLKAEVQAGICKAQVRFPADASHDIRITALPANHFHIVVFSLLLTYIPSPEVRWQMCEKAYRMMRTDGILLIITPDSSHQNKNAALMKRWKLAIEQIGFQRTKYSKDTHLHFMAFRKVPDDFLWDRKQSEYWNGEILRELNIPQDFQDSSDEEPHTTSDNLDSQRDELASNMMELPGFYSG